MDINKFLNFSAVFLELFEFHLQRNYLEILEDHIAQERESRQDWFQNNAFSFETEDEYHIAQEKIMLVDLHGDRLRKSFLVNLMSWLEWWTTELCKYYAEEKNLAPYNKPDKGVLKKNKNYLSKGSPPGWDFIMKSWKLRNCIVHNNGVIKDCDNIKTITDFVKSRRKWGNDLRITNPPWLSVDTEDTEDTVFIKQGFCEELLNETEQFAKSLLEEAMKPTTSNEEK